VLAGDGGDEAFAGYNWHYDIDKFFKNINFLRKLMIQIKGEKQFVMKTYASYLTGVSAEMLRLGILNDEIGNEIKRKGFWNYDQYYPKSNDHVKVLQTLDVNTFIPEPCLTRADRASMAHSLETRVPFLDHEIFEFTFGLDTSVYLKDGIKKYLIHENLRKRLTPEILQMPKRGFSYHHLKELLSDREVENIISNGQLSMQGIVKRSVKISGLSAQMKFHLVMLELWFRKWNCNG
jgi:asparagine synthase (glutamine-hydrolysing)